MKICNTCGESLSLDSFYKGKCSCKKCVLVSRQLRILNNPIKHSANLKRYNDTSREYKKKWRLTAYRSIHGRASHLLRSMTARSKTSGFPPPELTISEIETAIQGTCSRSGIPFVFEGPVSSKSHPFAPSPDRINTKIGYTRENVQWVCWIYNVMKSDFTQEDVSQFILGLIGVQHHDNYHPS